MLILCQTELSELHEGYAISDHLLTEVGPIERIDAVGSYDSSLNLDVAKLPLILSRQCIGLVEKV